MIQDGFWSHDYISGVEALTKSLSVSVAENKQFLTMVQERARIEHNTAAGLAQLSQEPVMHAVPMQTGTFISKSSSLQSALGVFTTETINQAVIHTRIASDLDSRVRAPLQKWCNMYSRRVEACSARLTSLAAGYNRLLQAVNKQRLVYYENCQKYEDSTSGGSPRDPIIKTIRMLKEKLKTTTAAPSSPEAQKEGNKTDSADDTATMEYTVAGLQYTRRELKDLLRVLLADVTLIEYKVPLFGSYQNVATGSMLSTAARKHLRNDSFAYAEKFGQSLVDLGFLKPIGQISNRYQSLHTSYYQWQEQAFELIDEPSDESDGAESLAQSDTDQTSLGNTSAHETGQESEVSSPRSSLRGRTADSLLEAAGGSIGTNSDGTLAASDPSEEHYLQAVLELDKYRCDMELEFMEIYQFLDRLEKDREEAIKRGMLDYIQVTFLIEEQQQMKTRLVAAQDQVDPAKDLRELIAKNKTGPFVPTVTVFRGYFNGNVVQTFGVDLPQSKFFVDITVDWLEQLPIDESAKLSLWTEREPIAEVYKLRTQINTGKPFVADALFRFFPLSVVISTFCQYLLELPESVISFIVYERFKQLYSETSPSPNDIALVLVQIPLVNYIVLQRIINYLSSTFEESQYSELASALSLNLARPRAPSTFTMDDEHPAKLIQDLLKNGPAIFDEVDRKREEARAMKADQKPRVVRSFNAESPTPSTPSAHRVVTNSGMRPLSLNFHAGKSGPSGGLTPSRSEISGISDSPSPKLSHAPRGLGISPILPISVEPQPSLASSPHPSSSVSSSPASPSPMTRTSLKSPTTELRLPRVRKEAGDRGTKPKDERDASRDQQ